MLGKRSRPPMKRTTSMSEITFDLGSTINVGEALPSLSHNPHNHPVLNHHQQMINPSLDHGIDKRFLAMVSPRNHRRHSSDFGLDYTPNYLRVCSLCNRRLVPGRDIYVYRGDSGFCSPECRQQQMKKDERKGKFSLASKKLEAAHHVSSSSSPVRSNAVAQVSTINGETFAAL